MKILLIHPNFPGQYKHIARALVQDKKNQVIFACRFPNDHVKIPGLQKVTYKENRKTPKETHRYLHGLDQGISYGQALWRVCNQLKKQDFVPDIICGHLGWGDGLFLKDIYPNTPILSYMEYFYRPFGADMHFFPQENEKINPDKIAHIRVRNTINLLNLDECDHAITPTKWQASLHPKAYYDKMTILHEGIDTAAVKPNRNAKIKLSDGTTLTQDDEIITYVARNFEPYRGFEQAMQAIELILKQRPKAHIIMVGSDNVSYSAKPKEGTTYRQSMMEKVKLDSKRVHWTGKLPYNQFCTILQCSQAHIYLTVPFVMSWSLLEAMASGCAIVASDTAPVQEVIHDGKNGLLVDFFSPKDIAKRVGEILDHPDRMADMRKKARTTILTHYDLKKLLPQHIQLITDIAAGKKNAATKLPSPKKQFESEVPDLTF